MTGWRYRWVIRWVVPLTMLAIVNLLCVRHAWRARSLGTRPAAPGLAQISWTQGFGPGMALARQRGRAALVFLTADWCDPGHRMQYECWRDPRVVSAAGGCVGVWVDVDCEPEVCRRLRIASYPAVVLLSPGGEEWGRWVGQQPPAPLAQGLSAELSRLARVATGERPLRR